MPRITIHSDEYWPWLSFEQHDENSNKGVVIMRREMTKLKRLKKAAEEYQLMLDKIETEEIREHRKKIEEGECRKRIRPGLLCHRLKAHDGDCSRHPDY